MASLAGKLLRQHVHCGFAMSFTLAPLTSYRQRVYRAVRTLHPRAVATRAARAVVHRGALITPGPNHSWSMDAFCKLEHWGIQVYAAIDTYSRYIVWIYVGPSARTQSAVAAQYLKTLNSGKMLPKLIRTDRGVETTLAADIHYHISQMVRGSSSPLSFGDCFQYGTSKQNSRIESWWNQQSRATTGRWRDYFLELSRQDCFNKDSLADRIAFKAIYTPILRQELTEFVGLWNYHRIRSQPERPYLVTGIPHMLYWLHESAEQCGTAITDDQIRPLMDQFDYDLDAYLPATTVEWCHDRLQHYGGVDGRKKDDDTGDAIHVLAYNELRNAVRGHLARGDEPELSELPSINSVQQVSNTTRRVFAAAGLAIDELDMPA